MNLISGRATRLKDGISFAPKEGGATVSLTSRDSPLELVLKEGESRSIVFAVRPEHLRLESNLNPGARLFTGTISACEFTGPDKLIKAQISGTTTALTLRVAASWGGRVGDTVQVSAAEENLRFFDAATEQAIR